MTVMIWLLQLHIYDGVMRFQSVAVEASNTQAAGTAALGKCLVILKR